MKTIFLSDLVKSRKYSIKSVFFLFLCYFILSGFYINSLAGPILYDTFEYENFIFTKINNQTEIKIVSYTGNETKVIFPETINNLPVTEIDSDVFEYKFLGNEIYIPASIKTLTTFGFRCPNLKRIEVDIENKYFTSVDGVLFDKPIRSLLLFPTCHKEVNYTIPKTVIEINSAAFYSNNYLESICFPALIENIYSNSFYNCNSLEKLIFENNIPKIDAGAFDGCDELKLFNIKNKDIPLGNVLLDGNIKSSDARKVLRISAELEESTYFTILISDIDKSGDVSANDARIILRISAGLD